MEGFMSDWSDADFERLKAMRTAGYSYDRCAAELGMKKARISGKCSRNDLGRVAKTRVEVANVPHSERMMAGDFPLPPMHPISWGAINQHISAILPV
jgi:hypothetical protein